MKQKKAAPMMTNILVLGIVAIILAIIVISGIADPIVNWASRILPEYNNEAPPKDLPGQVRYNIQTDKVQYYDGKEWYWFPSDWEKDIEIGNAITDAGTIRYDFEQYYYNQEARGWPATFQFKERRDTSDGGIILEKEGVGMTVRGIQKPRQDDSTEVDETMRGAVVMSALLDRQKNDPNNLLEEVYYVIDSKDKFYRQANFIGREQDAQNLIDSARGEYYTELFGTRIKASLVYEEAFYPTRDEIYLKETLKPSRIEEETPETIFHLNNLNGGTIDPRFKNLPLDSRKRLTTTLETALKNANIFWEMRMTGKDGTTYYFKQIKFKEERGNAWYDPREDKPGVAVYQASLGGYDGGLQPLNIYAIVDSHIGWQVSGKIYLRNNPSGAYLVQTEEGTRTWSEWWEGESRPDIPAPTATGRGAEKEIYENAIEWRDRIFQNQMRVNLFNELDNPQAGTTCWLYDVEKTALEGTAYIYINLRTPVTRC